MKVTLVLNLLVVLTLTNGLLALLLFNKYTSTVSFVEAPSISEFKRSKMVVPSTPLAPKVMPISVLLNAPVIKQYPELLDGCEVTSLAMLLQYLGLNKSKIDLAYEMPKDSSPLQYDNGKILSWGDPNVGFVGEVTGKTRGFGIYHAGLLPLLKSYVPEAIDLTGRSFDELELQLAAGYPVIVWSTIDFTIPDTWVTWESPSGSIRTTFAEHTVLLVGYDETKVYINNPATGKKNEAIDKDQFIETWKVMGQQALSYRNKGYQIMVNSN